MMLYENLTKEELKKEISKTQQTLHGYELKLESLENDKLTEEQKEISKIMLGNSIDEEKNMLDHLEKLLNSESTIKGNIFTVCPECLNEQRVLVTFKDWDSKFETCRHDCVHCGEKLIVTDNNDLENLK